MYTFTCFYMLALDVKEEIDGTRVVVFLVPQGDVRTVRMVERKKEILTRIY